MRVLMISNPNSTSQSDELFRRILPRLQAVPGLHLVCKFTHYAGHAREMVRGLRRADYGAIIACGGDGTVNEVVNGLLGPVSSNPLPRPEELPVLAVIPTGSANVFVRALGFPAAASEAAEVLADLLARDLRRTIALGTWNDNWFAVNAGFGLDADVLARIDRARAQGFAATPLRYLRVSIQSYLRARRHPPHIDVRATTRDGVRLEVNDAPLMLTSNTNPWTFLGPLPVVTNPENSFDGGLGLFGVSDLGGISGLVGVAHLMGIDQNHWLNKVVRARTIHLDDASDVELSCPRPHRFQADGESEGEFTTVELTSVPDAIEVYAPRESSEPYQRTWRQILRDVIRIN